MPNIQINPNGDDSADVQEQLLDSREIAAGTKEIPESAVPATTTAAITAASDAAATADSKAVTAQADATQALSDAATAQSTANESKIVLGMPAAPVYPEPKPYSKKPVAVCFDGTDKKIAYKVGDIGVLQSFNADTVATADENNMGGTSINRMVSSRVLGNAIVGILTPRSISSDVSLITLTNTEYDELVGRNDNCDTASPYVFSRPTDETMSEATVTFSDRVVYDLASGKAVNFWVKNRAIITFYCDPAETQSSDVRINYNNGAIGAESIDLTGLEGRVDIEVEQSGDIDGYISVRNNNINKCYVVGVNITDLSGIDPSERYDSFKAWNHVDYDYWLGSSNGANDFALKANDIGKLFGSYHGGHSAETLTLEIGGQVIDSASFVDGEFLTGESATFTSESSLSDGSNTASVTCLTTFAGGGDRVQTTVAFDSTAVLDDAYTAMTINNVRFSSAVSPIYKDLSVFAADDEIELGKTVSGVFSDPISGHSIETRATWFSHEFTDRPGPYIKVRSGDNKFYLNSLHGASASVDEFTAVTYRYYNE